MIKFKTAAEFERAMASFIRKHPEAIARVLAMHLKGKVVPHAKARHQRGRAHGEGRYEDQTGTLTKSISTLNKMPEVIDGKKVVGKVYAATDYAERIEFGSSGGVTSSRSGGMIYTGNRPYPFMSPAITETAGDLRDELYHGLEEFGEKLGVV